ncbi:1-acyl-sn-glycerol-3-phosphate acyltransferase [Nocardioides albertanoniae]|uniref:1-acyl-sn-glycerol-3-phosphate acyltransferase n=1 Tax=Nocardioides albertanoniae TaxID=1175486 RepID=A0A543A9M6_9ACTN|nr:1-acyl-sn-glycerol-3-phosphate acyltransferase [Nocardioides albertanoniae]
MTEGDGVSTKLFYSFLKWVAIGPLLRTIFRPSWEGVENVPRKGQAILASNHLSYADWLFMPLGMKRMVRFVAKAEYFTGTGLKGALQRTFFSGTGNVPIDRTGATAAEGALIAAKRVLGEGELFGIYPEGTRSHDGKLYRGRTGVARLALDTGAPVIPVAVIGTDLIAPPGKKFGKIVQPRIVYGKPLDFSRYDGMANDRYILRAITDEIVYEILKLSGQEYVDMYATEAKKLDDAAKASKKKSSAKAAKKKSRPSKPGPTEDVA